MNVISNNCCGGWLYKHNNMEYMNPFMWSITQYDSLIYLLEHFYDINWANVKLCESPIRSNTYQISVDGRVAIHYIHCRFNYDKLEPTKVFRPNIGTDIDYCKIWEYVYEKYISRAKRMIDNGEPPIFLLVPNEHTCKWNTNQMTSLMSIPTTFKRILITPDHAITANNEHDLVIHTSGYASPNQVITNNLVTINKFIGLVE